MDNIFDVDLFPVPDVDLFPVLDMKEEPPAEVSVCETTAARKIEKPVDAKREQTAKEKPNRRTEAKDKTEAKRVYISDTEPEKPKQTATSMNDQQKELIFWLVGIVLLFSGSWPIAIVLLVLYVLRKNGVWDLKKTIDTIRKNQKGDI